MRGLTRASITIELGAAPTSRLIRSNEHRVWRRFRRHKLGLLGSGVLIVLVLAAILAPVVTPHDPDKVDLEAVRATPTRVHLLGTDGAGRDILSRVIYGARVSLSVGLVAAAISTLIGTTLGATAGYYGGPRDGTIMRFTDTVMSFPPLVIIISVVSLLGPDIYNVMIVLGLLSWPGTCRLVRSVVLSLRETEFVQAARCIGASNRRIIFRHILPNVVPPVIVAATFGVAIAILTEAGLSFLGLGVRPPTASWGNMMYDAQSLTILQTMPWIWVPPGLMIAVAVLSINFLGDGLRDAIDPRMAT